MTKLRMEQSCLSMPFTNLFLKKELLYQNTWLTWYVKLFSYILYQVRHKKISPNMLTLILYVQLKDSITEDSRPISFSKDKALMPRVDQIAPSTEECEKTKIWKLNIQDDSVLLQKHISASTANDNSHRILAGKSSGSRDYAPDPKSKELELPNRISTNPAAENGMRILHEDPYRYGQKSPQPPQRDGGDLELLKRISDYLAADSGKEIQLEDPSGSGEQSNQRNGKELHLLKQISAAPAGNICKEILHAHRSGFEQQSPNRKDTLNLLLKFSSAQASDSDKELQENPSESRLQSLLLQQNGEFQSPQQVPAMQGAVNGKEILHEYPFGSGQQSHQKNASHGCFRKLSRSTTGDTVCKSPHVLELSVVPLPPSKEDKEVDASESSVTVGPLLWRSMVAAGKLNMPKTPSDVDGCHDPSLIIENELFPDEKHRRSGISFNQDFMNGVRIESGLCFKCDKRGSLLFCSGRGCSVAVHDRCIGSLVVFDEKGHFFCPSCSYAQASLEYYKAKKKYSQAKKALASFMGKGSVRRHQERLSHPAVLRNTSPIRLVGNMDCNDKCRKCQENTKTSRHHNKKESTIHHNIDNLPGRAEISQSVKRVEVSCDAGGLEDREKPVDDHEGIMQRQTHAALLLDNEKLPCSSVYLNVEVTPLRELKNEIVDGRQSTEMMKHLKTLTDKVMREGCQNLGDKRIVEAKETPDDCNLACTETAPSRIKEIHNVHQANVKGETASVKTCLETQVKDVTEQNMSNLQNGKTLSPVTTAKHAKRKLNLQINNEGCQITGAVKKQFTEAATTTAGTANLTCEQGETSGIREAHPSQVNVKSKITPDKFSEIQNQKHQEQATHVEKDTHNPPYQAVVAPLTNERNGRKRRLHTAISQNQHPRVSSKKQIGRPSVCNDKEGQNESSYE